VGASVQVTERTCVFATVPFFQVSGSFVLLETAISYHTQKELLMGLVKIFAISSLIAIGGCKHSNESSSDVKRSPQGAMEAQPRGLHTETESKWMPLDEETTAYHADYAWLNTATHKREHHLEIWDKGLQMINGAEKFVVFSMFLFDCMYSPGAPVRDVTGEVLMAIERRRSEFPTLKVAVILDPINRAYLDRVASGVKRFNDAGIDVFYTDLLATPAAASPDVIQAMHTHGITYEQLTKPQVTKLVEGAFHAEALEHFPLFLGLTPIVDQLMAGKPLIKDGQPVMLDGVPFNLELIYNIALLKANHRKLLVTDADQGKGIEALVGSSNPHNGSIPSANSAISFKGPLAASVYNVVRADIAHSIDKYQEWMDKKDLAPTLKIKYAQRFAQWSVTGSQSTENYLRSNLPFMTVATERTTGGMEAKFVTESKIRDAIIESLKDVEPGDEIRIQMFYLSNPPVIDAILAAGKVTGRPIRLILDPNKDAFNSIKDGTPNRQVAKFMRDEALKNSSKINIRWYDTHGEQNHAKVMSITKEDGRCLITTGSANWTGKNIGGANMESNIVVRGAQKLCDTFNPLFDRFWANEQGKGYTVDWNTAPYNQNAGMEKWTSGERSGLVSW
jgi:hypothetical protein